MPNQYVNKVVQRGGNTLIDISDTTAVASDVASGKYFYLATGEKVEGTGSGGGGGSVTWGTMVDKNVTIVSSNPNYFVITNYTTPFRADETYRVTWGSGGTEYICQTLEADSAQIYDGYAIGNLVYGGGPDTGEPFIIYRDSATRLVCATNQSAGSWHIKIELQTTTSATLITKSITANGTYNASSDNADGYSSVTVNVQSGGTSKNVQVAQGVDRVNTTSYSAVNGQSITVATTGTYNVYWMGFRSSTSGTSGSCLYVNGSAHSSGNHTTFSNHGQSIKLTGVSLSKDDVVTVRAAARGTQYYMYVGNLTIEQTA